MNQPRLPFPEPQTRWHLSAVRSTWREADGRRYLVSVGETCVDWAWPWWVPLTHDAWRLLAERQGVVTA